ncbi:unnamed protein product [Cladocopium goreaui]|uniref:Uncharacterized protein n=1 Tax=Cladocopium goreaui TaxID=2562237 RepID=A0A9P1BPP6_9DINO|nr:unnamed protein product [Cladocopium goreaui]
MWEDKSLIRDRARSLKKILDWPTVNGVYLVGAPSKRAFAMNKVILDLTAQWWTPQRDYPESVQIALIREEDECLLDIYDTFSTYWEDPSAGSSTDNDTGASAPGVAPPMLAILDGSVYEVEDDDPPVVPVTGDAYMAPPAPVPAVPAPMSPVAPTSSATPPAERDEILARLAAIKQLD